MPENEQAQIEGTDAAPSEAPEASAAPAEDEKPKKERKKKAEKPVPVEESVYVGPNAVRAGTVYDRLRKIVSEKPGLPISAAVTHILESGFSAKDAGQFVRTPASFVRGYLVAGLKKGHFAAEAGHTYAVQETTTEKPARKEKQELPPTSVKILVATLTSVRATERPDDAVVGVGIPLAGLTESTGLGKSQITKSVNRLVQTGYLEKDQLGEPPVDNIFLTEKGAKAAEAAEAAPAPSPSQDAGEV